MFVGFAKDKNGEERIVRIDSVLPYPPYEKKGIRLYEESRELAEDSFAPVVAQEGTVKKSLFVKYGDHTLVRFGAAENLIEGPLGACPDYNSTSFIRVWTDGAQANPDYWRNAWFSCDMRGAAEDVVKGLRARTEGRPVTVGVFYDPCVCLPKGWKPTYPEDMTEDAPRSPLADRRPGGRDVRGRHVRLHPRRYGHRARDRPFLRKSLGPFQLRLTSGRGASPHLRLLQPARVVAPRLLRGRLPLNTILIEAESNPHILFVHCAAYERREEMDFFKLAITVLGGLSIFIYGMGLMSEGLTQIAGSRLKAALWSDARSALPLSPKGGLAMRMEERKRRKERRTRIEIAIGLAVVALLYLLQLFA